MMSTTSLPNKETIISVDVFDNFNKGSDNRLVKDKVKINKRSERKKEIMKNTIDNKIMKEKIDFGRLKQCSREYQVSVERDLQTLAP